MARYTATMATFIQIYCRHGRSGVLTNQLTTINTILHHIQHNSTQPHTILNKIHHKQTIYSIQFTIFNISIWNNIPYTTKYLKNSAQKTTSWPEKLKVLDLPVTFPGLPFFPFPFLKLHNTGIKKSSLPVYVMKISVYVRESTFMLLSQSTNCKYFGVVVF